MTMPLKIDWKKIDWSKSNALIARENICGKTTVARWRQRLGMPKPEHRITPEHKKAMTEGRQRALKSGKYDAEYARKRVEQSGVPHSHSRRVAISESHLEYGEDHMSAKHHELMSPSGTLFKIKNIHEFVRNNPQLFDKIDVVNKRKPNGKSYSRATCGLLAVSSGNKKTWKGWAKF